MRVQDFENAITALKCSVVLDGVKLKDGQVQLFYGHRGNTLLVWDESGRAFSYSKDQPCEEFIEEGSGKNVMGRRLKRDAVYDLKFE